MGDFGPADEHREIANRHREPITARSREPALEPIISGQGLDFATAWQDFEASLLAERKATRTIDSYREAVWQLASFLREMGLADDVTAITGEHIRHFLGRLNRLHKPATTHNRFRGLRRFFQWLVDEDEILAHPMAKMRPPKVPEQVRQGFTDDELRRLLKVTEGRGFLEVRDRAILMSLLSTGLRLAELCSLTVEDVQGPHVLVRGKGGKERVVRMGFKAQEAARRYLRRRRGSSERALWLSQRGQPLLDNGIKQMFYRRSDEAGVKDCHPHKMRRTHALRFLEKGGYPEDLQVLMGHSSAEIMRVYTRARERERALKAHERFDPADEF